MTKEELIALSDLNREDNIKYISSEAQGIAISLDSDRYAPTLCKLERAYICGRRKSEERIEQLERENAELKEKLEIEQNAKGDWFGKAVTKDRRLNEAKEIIREYMRFEPMIGTCSFYVEEYEKTKTKAEQFLSEVEK